MHKRHPHKIAKNRHPPTFLKMPVLAQPPLSVQTHYKFWKIWSFFIPKSADVRIWRAPLPLCPHWTNPLSLTAVVFNGRP